MALRLHRRHGCAPQSGFNPLQKQFAFVPRLRSVTLEYSPLACGQFSAATSDCTLYKAFSACIWSYLPCLTLKAPCLLKYKQIQADSVLISNQLNMHQVPAMCSARNLTTGKYKENTFFDLKAYVINNTGQLTIMEWLRQLSVEILTGRRSHLRVYGSQKQ